MRDGPLAISELVEYESFADGRPPEAAQFVVGQCLCDPFGATFMFSKATFDGARYDFGEKKVSRLHSFLTNRVVVTRLCGALGAISAKCSWHFPPSPQISTAQRNRF